MQTPKISGSTKSSLEGARKISPRSVSSSRVVRQLKTTDLQPNSSSNQPSPRTTKTIDRTSPRSPVPAPQKKCVGRVAELETQITQLEDALRTVKDQLILSESWKKQAKQDAEDSRNQLLAMSLKLQESSSNETHGIKKPESTDSALLAAALLEIDQLKVKLDTKTDSEATKTKQAESAHAEIQILNEKMAEMKNQLEDCKSSESQAQTLANETLLQLETAKTTIESLTSTSEYNTILLELDESKAFVNSLEAIIDKMKTKDQESESEEIIALKSELGKLKSAQIRSHEALSCRIMEITDELNKSKADIEDLKANLMDKETELQAICEENDDLNAKLVNFIMGNQDKQDFDSLKSNLTRLEEELCKKFHENEKLIVEIKKMEGINDKVARVSVQLEAAQTANSEMEGELRRLKVQMDQWRKAAEVATAMLCNENNDNNNNNKLVVERTWSMQNYSVNVDVDVDDDDDDEFLKKKNGNMLRRIGVLWKKPQNK